MCRAAHCGLRDVRQAQRVECGLLVRALRRNEVDGDVHVGRKLKSLLRQAGFGAPEFSASYECYDSLESIGEYLAQGIERAADGAAAGERQRVQSLAASLRAWYRSGADGVFAQSWCEIVGAVL